MWKFSAERWRLVREMKGISLSEMARKMGTNRQNIFNYESGMNMPTTPMLIKYAAVNDVTIGPAYFFVKENYDSMNIDYNHATEGKDKNVNAG